MRHSKATSATGTLRTNSLGARQLVIIVIAAVALIWAGIAFAQEAYISHRLSQQAADLRHQNTQLGAQNAAYRKDVKSITSGAATEEEARQNGFAKPYEKTYLVAPPPTPSPSPSPKPSPSPGASPHH
ncbi:MAG TPA: septum formation initiator family protein [Candidatus Dormibacteraeota bacterium]|nr:septum formation initiator family protein [Candidatus Dormibacteraeota bacterium]